ncbi:hypothetical protein AGMMS50268_13330 [Spirochaetia bacterium]|nr:hypothetical protein AGMMS50233_09880 [Endomicrobiia bacterium]GHV90830.1 hypothetical protein AGMMS50268_13330 [Spirochaetia bacterium]
MSKADKTNAELNLDAQLQNEGQPDNPNPGGDPPPDGNPNPNNDPPSKEEDGNDLLTVEEHAKRQNIDTPIFVAVLQSEQWFNGKKVTETVFKAAVEAFLKGPMAGKKLPEKKEEQ